MLTTLVHILYIYYIFKNYCTLFNIHIYHVSYLNIFKINVSTCQIRVVSDTHIVYMHHT